jgi:hypothetical protein
MMIFTVVKQRQEQQAREEKKDSSSDGRSMVFVTLEPVCNEKRTHPGLDHGAQHR